MGEPLRIGIVAGETSGDVLASGLIKAIKEVHPDAVIEGVAGPLMQAAGCRAIFDSEELAVMGIVEVIKCLPRILSIRRQLTQYFKNNKPDVFIGVDAPEFNLDLELKLRKCGIKTVHYTSPSVWAWRRNRLKKIARSTDLMLALLPFEEPIYQSSKIPVHFVGHPLADQLPMEPNKQEAREKLGLPLDKPIVAILPGSRTQELDFLSQPFIETAQWCREKMPELEFITAMVDEHKQKIFNDTRERIAPELVVQSFLRQSRDVITAADVVLLSSGTATLETMLLKRPMVVGYKMSKLTVKILRRIVYVDSITLPNLLAGKKLVPEYIQEDVQPKVLGPHIIELLRDKSLRDETVKQFYQLHQQLQRNASQEACHATLALCE